MRNLVTVRKVDQISPIAGADLIELARIGGWECVVKKGEFYPGDFGLFFEIDSFIPAEDARFSFLGSPKQFGNLMGYRIRTIKLRGQLSQGLLIPLRDFPEVLEAMDSNPPNFDGILGVVKWEPPASVHLHGESLGTFPLYIIPKTDQERIQNLGDKWEGLKSLEYEVSQKLDGSSMTVYYYNGGVGICSRNFEIKINEANQNNVFVRAAGNQNLIHKLMTEGRNLALQGEVCGPKIQGNPEMLSDVEFFLYAVWDIDNQRYFGSDERNELAISLGILHVPVLGTGIKIEESQTIACLLKQADGPSLLSKNPIREGWVYKSMDGTKSFKVISNRFLLKKE